MIEQVSVEETSSLWNVELPVGNSVYSQIFPIRTGSSMTLVRIPLQPGVCDILLLTMGIHHSACVPASPPCLLHVLSHTALCPPILIKCSICTDSSFGLGFRGWRRFLPNPNGSADCGSAWYHCVRGERDEDEA